MPFKKTPAGIPPDHKWCFSCSTAKPVQQFGIDRSKKDGRCYCCLSCASVKLGERTERGRMFAELHQRFRRGS